LAVSLFPIGDADVFGQFIPRVEAQQDATHLEEGYAFQVIHFLEAQALLVKSGGFLKIGYGEGDDGDVGVHRGARMTCKPAV
jgi:hypothetical protein